MGYQVVLSSDCFEDFSVVETEDKNVAESVYSSWKNTLDLGDLVFFPNNIKLFSSIEKVFLLKDSFVEKVYIKPELSPYEEDYNANSIIKRKKKE